MDGLMLTDVTHKGKRRITLCTTDGDHSKRYNLGTSQMEFKNTNKRAPHPQLCKVLSRKAMADHLHSDPKGENTFPRQTNGKLFSPLDTHLIPRKSAHKSIARNLLGCQPPLGIDLALNVEG